MKRITFNTRFLNISIVSWCLLPLFSLAQTVNQGELVILPGTDFGIVDSFTNEADADLINNGELYLFANGDNHGLFSFSSDIASGTLHLAGSQEQIISGSEAIELYDLSLNNNTPDLAFDLLGQVSIANSVDFQNGIFNTETPGSQLLFLSSSSYIGADNESHVQGFVDRQGNEDFEFPVGDQGFHQPISLAAIESEGQSFSSRYFLANSAPLYNHEAVATNILFIDNAQYWETINHQEEGEVIVGLSVGDNTPNDILSAQDSAIRILRWDFDRNLWIDEEGTYDPVSGWITTIIDLPQRSVFTLGITESLAEDKMRVYNAIYPGSNNDFLRFQGIEEHPNNTVEIFNRWGSKIFSIDSYDNKDNVFSGFSNQNSTDASSPLPSGTYFYVLKYETADGSNTKMAEQSGYLYIKDSGSR